MCVCVSVCVCVCVCVRACVRACVCVHSIIYIVYYAFDFSGLQKNSIYFILVFLFVIFISFVTL